MNLKKYLTEYIHILDDDLILSKITFLTQQIADTRMKGGKLMLAGNGASASIASHLAADFSKQARIRAITFNEPNLITALSNDCGFENWIAKAIDMYADPADLLILISSSGTSANVVKAAQRAREKGIAVAALTGFAADNPLGKLADPHLWADSRAYNIVECTHMIWLTAACDLLIGKSEYAVKG
jgi:D-sedoheptulose 7-phosphate isomerase